MLSQADRIITTGSAQALMFFSPFSLIDQLQKTEKLEVSWDRADFKTA